MPPIFSPAGRIRGKQIKGAGTYLSLEKSRVLLSNGNNQVQGTSYE